MPATAHRFELDAACRWRVMQCVREGPKLMSVLQSKVHGGDTGNGTYRTMNGHSYEGKL